MIIVHLTSICPKQIEKKEGEEEEEEEEEEKKDIREKKEISIERESPRVVMIMIVKRRPS